MENLMQYLMLYAPIVVAILSEIGVVMGIIKKVSEHFKKADAAINELKESTEYKDLKAQLKVVMDENAELKRNLNLVLEKITHMKVENGTIKNN